MAFVPLSNNEEEQNQSFLTSSHNDDDDEFAALDSMVPNALVPHAFNSNYDSYNRTISSASGGVNSVGGGGNAAENGNVGTGGFSGVSDSLFDRIRARTAEQQKYSSVPQQPPQPLVQPQASQPPMNATTVMSQAQSVMPMGQQLPTSQVSQAGLPASQPVAEPENQLNHAANNMSNNYTNTYANNMSNDYPNNYANNMSNNYANNMPNDYANSTPNSMSTAPRPPTYGPSRSFPPDPSSPESLQDRATQAWEHTATNMKTLLGKAASGANSLIGTIGTSMGKPSNGNGGFLLDEENNMAGNAVGGTGGNVVAMDGRNGAAATVPTGDAAMASSNMDQAYSMASYAKTFCEDLIGFFLQLPGWGQALVAVLVLWLIFTLHG